MRPASSAPDALVALATNRSTSCSRIALRWTAPVWGIAARQMAAPNSGVRIRRRLSPLIAFSPFTHQRLNVFLLDWAGPVQKRARPPSLLIRSLWSPDFDHRDAPAIRERRRRVGRCHRHGRSSRWNPSRGALHPEGIGERIGLAHDGLARWRDHRA